ncbi:phosphodiester glycosidase family protein [Actinomadura rubrisoli]|uniref:Phosphodiester glycosidase family protein n=1 Tax=Actinomadura rubrisoli TaxID=2530368 RepID=A0A4R5C365_9ACTN|nr:phosphodiester glycosidase family protein [Actinomadura rubrisoli]TDD93305.1 phosphodiester glycosidase family protein [Actinomadura rubrisoli]
MRGWTAALVAAGSTVALCGAVPARADGPGPPDVDGAGSGERPDARSVSPAPTRPGGRGELRYTSETRLSSGVVFKTYETSGIGGRVVGDLLDVDLRDPHVRVGLLHPPAIAARQTVSRMANARGALAGINGDFFNISETHPGVTPTGSSSGPEVDGGRALKAAVPDGQRFGPALPPTTSAEDVIGVGADRRGHVARLHLSGTIRSGGTSLALRGLNQYALPVGTAGAFTGEWGTVSRLRAVCGTDTRRNDPCDTDAAEVTVRRGVVTEVADEVGGGAIPGDTTVLVGRGKAAGTLRGLRPGDRVRVRYRLTGTERFRFAIGGFPILRDGEPLAGLDPKGPAPRTAAGVGRGGRHLYLVVADGRSARSGGLTVAELAGLLDEAGADDGINLDGGGSSAFVARGPGEPSATVRNVPSDGAERAVANGIGVFAR